MRKTARVDVFVPGNVGREYRIGDKRGDTEIVDIKTSNEQDLTMYVSLIYSDGSIVAYTGIPFMEVIENKASEKPPKLPPVFETIFKPYV